MLIASLSLSTPYCTNNNTYYCSIVGPLIFGSAFAWGTSKGRKMPGAPFFVVALFSLMAEGVFRTLGKGKLGTSKDGKAGGGGGGKGKGKEAATPTTKEGKAAVGGKPRLS